MEHSVKKEAERISRKSRELAKREVGTSSAWGTERVAKEDPKDRQEKRLSG